MFHDWFGSIVFVSLCALLSPAVGAQGIDQQGTVAAQGTIVLKRMPSSMRMTVQLTEKSKTLEEALAKLKDRREAAVLMLKQLNANEASIVLSDPGMSAGGSRQQLQMQQILRQRKRARGGKGFTLPSSVTVVCVVTADWTLKATSTEQLLLTTKKLRDQVIAADLAGLKEPKKLTPEEEELAEEAAEQSGRYGGYGEEEAQPGKPQFVYVARITPQQRRESLSAAFAKSKKQASDLADAANAELGSLVQISSVVANVDYGGGYGYAERMYMQQIMRMQAMAGTDGQQNENESFSPNPGKVVFRFLVQTKFRLK